MKAEQLIGKLWNAANDTNEFADFMAFVSVVVNASISSLADFNRFADDKRFDNVDLLFIARSVHPDLNIAFSSYDVGYNQPRIEVITERGICYSIIAHLASRLMNTT